MQWLEDIANGAITQGVNQPTLLVLNGCLGLTVLSLVLLLLVSINSAPALAPHAAVLLVLALALWVAINLFIGSVGLVSAEDQQRELHGDVQPGSEAKEGSSADAGGGAGANSGQAATGDSCTAKKRQ